MKPAVAWLGFLFAACGYHDTPVATYEATVIGGGAGAAGANASGAGGTGGSVSEAGASDGGAGPLPEPLCMQTYPTTIDGSTSRYRQGASRQIWVVAERDCEAEGGHLVVIDDEVENAWVAQIAAQSLTNEGSSHQLAWIGLDDHAKEGEFRWVTDAPLTLTSWFSSEPNSLYDSEDCGEMRATGKWPDDRCNAKLAYVCECDGVASAHEWCDTDLEATCGDCSTACSADQTCMSQICK